MAFALAHVPPKEKSVTVERYEQALNELRQQVSSVRIVSRSTVTDGT